MSISTSVRLDSSSLYTCVHVPCAPCLNLLPHVHMGYTIIPLQRAYACVHPQCPSLHVHTLWSNWRSMEWLVATECVPVKLVLECTHYAQTCSCVPTKHTTIVHSKRQSKHSRTPQSIFSQKKCAALGWDLNMHAQYQHVVYSSNWPAETVEVLGLKSCFLTSSFIN